MRLPTPSEVYQPQNEAQARTLIESALTSLEGGVQSLRDLQPVVDARSANGSLSIAAPRASGVYVLDVTNTTGGAITVTLAPAFLGTFPGPGAGKRRTQMYVYDRGTMKFVPIGAQSPDF
jgi:hypothetical protein